MRGKLKAFVNNFLKFFQKNRKFQKKYFLPVAIIVLFIVVSISIPVHQAHAGALGDAVAWGMEQFLKTLSKGGEIFINFIYAIIFSLLNIGLNLSIILVKFGAWLIDATLDPRLYTGDPATGVPGVLTSSTVNIGWTTVRDMCNTFYMFFLLIIAFGTIFRSSTFNAKNLLPKLVISLFLINFSAVIAKLVIDFGQVFMFEIMNWMGGFRDGAGSLTSIVDRFNDIFNAKLQASFDQIVKISYALVYSLVLGFVYIMLALFLLIRLVAFVFLIILSPIAFLSIVLPSLSKYTSRWWSELVKYSLFGPIFMFFVYLSATMANELVTNFTPIPTTSEYLSIFNASDLLVTMFQNAIPLLMLMAVIPVTQELGMKGADKIIGGTAGIGKVAIGTFAGMKLAGKFGKKVGGAVTRRSDRLSTGVDRVKRGYYDKIGKIPGMQGTALKGKAGIEKEREEKLKKMEMEWGDLKSIDLKLLEEKANSKFGTVEDKALLLKAAAAQGKLGDVKKDNDGNVIYDKNGNPEMKYAEYMTGAETSLSQKDFSEITSKNLNMALQTSAGKERVAEIKKDPSKAGLSQEAMERLKKGESTAEEEYLREKMADIVKDGKAHEVQDLGNALTAKVWHESQDAEQRKSSLNRMNKEDKEKLADGYVKNIKEVKGSDEEKLAIEQKNMEFSTNAVKLGKELEKSFTWGGEVMKEKIEEAFPNFNHKDIARMSPKDLDKYGHKATEEQITGLNKAGDYETVRKIEASKEKKSGNATRVKSMITRRTEDINRDVF